MSDKKTTVIHGLKLSWLEAGEKNLTLLLFLHGFPDTAHVWDEQIQFFSKNFHVIAPMMRGVDGSELGPDDRRCGLDAMSLDILSLLDQISGKNKKDIVVIGHDLGTLHAWHLAPLLGHRLKGLVIINGAHPLQAWERRKNFRQVVKSWYTYFFFLPILPEILIRLLGPYTLKNEIKNNGGKDLPESKTGDGIPHAHKTVKQYRQIARSLPSYLTHKGERKIAAPVLAISALGDKYLEPATFEELSRYTKKPFVRIIPGKHWLQYEQPDRLNNLIGQFLREECA
jgi:pimeloyl-ACP methyl ester carboxylesterase